MVDMNLQCCDCKIEFVFDVHEQQFFASVGLVNLPKRCPKCRLVGRLRRAGKQDTDFTEMAWPSCPYLLDHRDLSGTYRGDGPRQVVVSK